MPIPGTFLLIRWALDNYPELWWLIGPLLALLAGLVLGSWWQMIVPPLRRCLPPRGPDDVPDWDQE